jgi:D-alanyl-D-alanine carboxypeptidase
LFRSRIWLLPFLMAFVLLIGYFAVLNLFPATAQSNLDREALQAIVDTIPGNHVTSVIYRVQKGDDVEYFSAGVGDVETGEPVSIDGHFRIGSVSKPFLAVAVLQLHARGLLDIDQTVQHYLPDLLPESYAPVTLRNLLQHTSGIPDYELALGFGDAEFIAQNVDYEWNSVEIVAEFVQQPQEFTPGEKMSYSNTGYLILSMVVEEVTGEHYSQAIRKGILEPLELENTVIPGLDKSMPEPFNHGYIALNREEGRVLFDISESSQSYAGAAGDMISTLDDLHVFFQALLDGQLLPESVMDDMLTPAKGLELSVPGSNNGQAIPGFSSGLGILTADFPGSPRLYWHNGWIPGYQTVAWMSRDGSVSMIGSAAITFEAGKGRAAAETLLGAMFAPAE